MTQALLALLVAATPIKVTVLDLEATGVPEEVARAVSLGVPTSVRELRPRAQVMSGAEVRTLIGLERQRFDLSANAASEQPRLVIQALVP